MTTMYLTTATPLTSVVSSVPRTRLRLTRRGRRVLASLAAAPAVIALGIAIVSGGAAIASADRGVNPDQFASVTVLPGDTLWSIASDVAPEADPRDVIDDIVRLNVLDSAQLDVGETLAIPAKYGSTD